MQAMRTQRFSRNRAAAGFTMIELLIAIVILLVGVVAVAQLVPNAIRSDFRNRYDSTALILAQQQMEQMVEQKLTVGGPPAAGTYNFQIFLPDGTTTLCNLGLDPAGLTAPVGAPPPPPAIVTSGAPLIAGTLRIDWGVGQVAGYWNQYTAPDGNPFETRWNIAVFYGNINGRIRPVGKRIIVSTQGATPQSRFYARPTTLTTMVAWRND